MRTLETADLLHERGVMGGLFDLLEISRVQDTVLGVAESERERALIPGRYHVCLLAIHGV